MKKQIDKNWQGSLGLSVILHIILIFIFCFGLPSSFVKPQKEREAMTFEILPLSSITNVKTESKSREKEKKAKKSRKIVKSSPKPKKLKPKMPKVPKVKNPQTKKLESKAEPKKQELQKKKIAKKTTKQIQKKEIIPEKQKKNKTKTKTKTKAPPAVQKKTEDTIDSILKNLEKDSEGDNAKTNIKSHTKKTEGEKDAWGDYDDEHPLSISEELWIKNQMRKYWRIPAGANNLDQIKIFMHITLKKSGVIDSITVTDIQCPANSKIMCKSIEESALRAIKKASPLEKLKPERYDSWKEFDLEFDPTL